MKICNKCKDKHKFGYHCPCECHSVYDNSPQVSENLHSLPADSPRGKEGEK